MSSKECGTGVDVTVSRLVLDRDDAALARGHGVAAFPIEEGTSYRKDIADAVADMADSPVVEAVACGDGVLWAMFPIGTDARRLCLGGVRPILKTWGEVDDWTLARLLVNSYSRAEGLTDPVNETGHLYRVVKREANAIRALEPVVGRDLAISIRVVSFVRRSYLKGRHGGKMPEELAWRPSFRVNEAGAVVYSRKPTDDDYIMRSPRKYDHRVFAFIRGDGAEEEVAETKLGFLSDVLGGMEARSGGVVRARLLRVERSRLVEPAGSERLKSDALATVAGEVPAVSYSETSLRSAARSLSRAVSDGTSRRGIAPGRLNIRLVPDDVSMADGYGVFRTEAVQHVNVSTASRLIKEAKKRKVDGTVSAPVLDGIMKELAVKRDIAVGRIEAFDWRSFGISEFRCARAVGVRTKVGKKVGQKEGNGKKGAGETLGERSEDRYDQMLGILTVGETGEMSFEKDGPLGVLDFDWTESLLGDEGALRRDVTACSMVADGCRWDFTITDTELFTVPNDLSELIRDQVEKGELARKRPWGEGRLAPLYGIGAFEMDGAVWYYVGHDAKMNRVLSRMTRLRRVDGLEGEVLERFLALLNIGLARVGQPTVYPIPVKYLNEYARLAFGYEGEQGSLF